MRQLVPPRPWTAPLSPAPPAPRPTRAPARSTVLGPNARPPRATTRGGFAVTVALWAGLVLGIWLWFRNTPEGSVDSTAAVLVETGRITGLVGGYALLVQVLLMSRVGWVERRLSGGYLMGWHRDLGAVVVLLVLAHAVTLILGMAAYEHLPVVPETWLLLTTAEDMISAFMAAGVLVAIALLAIRRVRAVLPYEIWYFTHLASYAVLLLSYGHIFAGGRELSGWAAGRWYWLGLYGFVVANLVWGRLLHPILLNARHRLRVAEVVAEGPDTFSVYIRGRRLDMLRARAGQYFRWRFLTTGCWWQAHPFSLSAAPNGHWLRLTIKEVGDHTGRLRRLRPGVPAFAEGPSGAFTADRRTHHRAVLIAGGSGIAPIRALLEDLPRGTVVIYRASRPDELIFREELDVLAERRGAYVYYVVGSRHDPGPRRVMTPRGLRELVPDVRHRDVYLCGPEGLVSAALAVLERLRVPRRQIHRDVFEF